MNRRRFLLCLAFGAATVPQDAKSQRRAPGSVMRSRELVRGWTVIIFAPGVTGGEWYDVLFQHDASGRLWAESVTRQELYTRRWPVETWITWMIPRLPMSPVVEM